MAASQCTCVYAFTAAQGEEGQMPHGRWARPELYDSVFLFYLAWLTFEADKQQWMPRSTGGNINGAESWLRWGGGVKSRYR